MNVKNRRFWVYGSMHALVHIIVRLTKTTTGTSDITTTATKTV